MTTYYIVLLNGIPVDVTTIWSNAQVSQKQLSVRGKDAIILPCTPLEWKSPDQLELTLEPFDSEVPTETDIERRNL